MEKQITQNPQGLLNHRCGGSVKYILSQAGQTSGPMADGETLKEDFRLKAWEEKVTPQKKQPSPEAE